MRETIKRNLEDFKRRAGRAYVLGVVNNGGTLLCLPNADGELEPVKTEEEAMQILLDGADFGAYVDTGLLKLNFLYHKPVDSSQILDIHREKILKYLQDAYVGVDGIIQLHGTDTAPETARFMHLALPYFNPVEYWRNDKLVSNWTKPLVIVASQEPAATKRGNTLVPLAGSDADVN